MNDMRGYINMHNGIYYVLGSGRKKIAVTRDNFPITIGKHGERSTLLAVSYYVSNGEFRSHLGDDCEQEVKLAIGDKGW